MKKLLNQQYDQNHLECNLDIYYDNKKSNSVFIFFHGGGLESGDKDIVEKCADYYVNRGISLVSVNYRMYPNAKFPDFIEDCAKAVSWVMAEGKKIINIEKIFVGGSSAGAYIAMLLCFNDRFLKKYGNISSNINGYVFDAGQPTTHFNVLRERGEDTRLIRIDEAAPLYFINENIIRDLSLKRFLIICAEHDIEGRIEQNKLLYRTMLHFGFDNDKIDFQIMQGYKHCEYSLGEKFNTLILDFIEK